MLALVWLRKWAHFSEVGIQSLHVTIPGLEALQVPCWLWPAVMPLCFQLVYLTPKLF